MEIWQDDDTFLENKTIIILITIKSIRLSESLRLGVHRKFGKQFFISFLCVELLANRFDTYFIAFWFLMLSFRQLLQLARVPFIAIKMVLWKITKMIFFIFWLNQFIQKPKSNLHVVNCKSLNYFPE